MVRRQTAALVTTFVAMAAAGCSTPERRTTPAPDASGASHAAELDRDKADRTAVAQGVGCTLLSATDRGPFATGEVRQVEVVVGQALTQQATEVLTSRGRGSGFSGQFLLVPTVVGSKTNVNGSGPVVNGGILPPETPNRGYELYPASDLPQGTQISVDELVTATSTDHRTGATTNTSARVHCGTLVRRGEWQIDPDAVIPQ